MEWYAKTFQYWPFIVTGLRWTIEVSVLAMIFSSIIGLVAALARLSGYRVVDAAVSIYVDFFRTTPLLVQLVWIYYALPILSGYALTSVQAGVLGLSLYTGAFLTEIIRAGILSVEREQREASLALGLTRAQTMRRIIIPQAVMRMIPALTGVFMNLVKDSSLTSVIGVTELMRQTQVLSSYMQRNMEPLIVAALIYFCLTYPLSLLSSYLQRRNGDERKAEASSHAI